MSSRHPRFTPLLSTAVFIAALELYIHTVLAAKRQAIWRSSCTSALDS
jgi:hypothetical protein